MTDKKEGNWEKKSERFEVRLAHSEKQAFQAACDAQGDTPSEAVRRFINGYLYRADADALANAVRVLKQMVQRNWRPTAFAAMIGFVAAYLAASMT